MDMKLEKGIRTAVCFWYVHLPQVLLLIWVICGMPVNRKKPFAPPFTVSSGVLKANYKCEDLMDLIQASALYLIRIQLYVAVLSTAFEVLLGLQAIIKSHKTCQVRGGVFFGKG